jgi:hypothetical protein
MATVSSIIARARLEIGDSLKPFSSQSTGDGVTTNFGLSRDPVDPSSVTVTVDGVTQVSGADFTLDGDNGLILFTAPPAIGAFVLAVGSSYSYFTDADMTLFVQTAAAQHLLGRSDPMGYPLALSGLPPTEDYLLAILTTIEALWVLATSAAFDIDISTPEGVHIPRSERFQQLTQVINARKAQYMEMAEALNVGLNRIEMFTLRRISRTTNKYIPIYKGQEYEDNRPPVRVWPQIDGDGLTVPDGVVEPTRMDLTALANQVFSKSLTGLGNLTGLTLRAHVRPYPGNLSSLAQFTVTVTDVVNGVVTIGLTPAQTWSIQTNAFWDIESIDSSNNVKTLLFGVFYTDRQGQP